MNGIIWRYVVFNALQFSDDTVEDENDIVVPGGKNVMEVICERISVLGVTVSKPEQHSFYGWFSEFKIGKVKFELILGCATWETQWLLLIVPRTFLFFHKHSKKNAYQQGLDLIRKALKNEKRFQRIMWMTMSEFDLHRSEIPNDLTYPLPEFPDK